MRVLFLICCVLFSMLSHAKADDLFILPSPVDNKTWLPAVVSGNNEVIFLVRTNTLTGVIYEIAWADINADIIVSREFSVGASNVGLMSFDGQKILVFDNESEGYGSAYLEDISGSRVFIDTRVMFGSNSFYGTIGTSPMFKGQTYDLYGLNIDCVFIPTAYRWIYNGTSYTPYQYPINSCGLQQNRIFPGGLYGDKIRFTGSPESFGVVGLWEENVDLLELGSVMPTSIDTSLTAINSSGDRAVITTTTHSPFEQKSYFSFLEELGSDPAVNSKLIFPSTFNNPGIISKNHSSNIPRVYTDVTIADHNVFNSSLITNAYHGSNFFVWVYSHLYTSTTLENLIISRNIDISGMTNFRYSHASQDGSVIVGTVLVNGIKRGFVFHTNLDRPLCIADFDGNGGVDGYDASLFFEYWEFGIADVNGDGGCDNLDVEFFYEKWENSLCN